MRPDSVPRLFPIYLLTYFLSYFSLKLSNCCVLLTKYYIIIIIIIIVVIYLPRI